MFNLGWHKNSVNKIKISGIKPGLILMQAVFFKALRMIEGKGKIFVAFFVNNVSYLLWLLLGVNDSDVSSSFKKILKPTKIH
jgi:hypothetical protein